MASRLFQPFVTGKSGGVGLGLFVARQAAEAHGGRLEWRRDVVMTCFRLELPAGEVEKPENGPRRPFRAKKTAFCQCDELIRPSTRFFNRRSPSDGMTAS